MAYETDVFTRQQIYLEGVKNEQSDEFDKTMRDVIIAAILLLLMRSGYETIGEMPKSELRTLLAKVNAKLTPMFKNFKALTIKSMRGVMDADLYVTKGILNAFKPTVTTKIDLTAATPTRKALWARLTNDIIPGPGLTVPQLISTFFGRMQQDILSLIRRGYADNLTVKEIMDLLVGTKANLFKDGLMRKWRNMFGSTVDTVIQQISSYIGKTLGQLFSDQYEWISVLDANTTDICRGRNGNVYTYGRGPMPPAHYRCRSRTRPVFEANRVPVPPTYYAWVKEQPAVVQDDVVGAKRAGALRSGKASADDFPKYISDKRLTNDDYKAKRNLMLTK